ncbi:hypothetical protein THUN1379_22090 [Paludibacterium sp. THUN1379]|nr:hypothetical protein THUN1379_22090 [Paludibacterium sp. THUN1379]
MEKETARAIAPPVDKIQPKILIEPTLAKLAGSRKIPDPIMFSATKIVSADNPIFDDLEDILLLPMYCNEH